MENIRQLAGMKKKSEHKMPMLFHYRQSVSFWPPVFDTVTF